MNMNSSFHWPVVRAVKHSAKSLKGFGGTNSAML
jgi:hypothetical protein